MYIIVVDVEYTIKFVVCYMINFDAQYIIVVVVYYIIAFHVTPFSALIPTTMLTVPGRMIFGGQSLSSYQRQGNTCYSRTNMSDCICPYHNKRHEAIFRKCNIVKHNAEVISICTISEIYYLFAPIYKCKGLPGSEAFNPFKKTHLVHFSKLSKLNIRRSSDGQSIDFIEAGGAFLEECAFNALVLQTLDQPSVGPGHWHDILMRQHSSSLFKELSQNRFGIDFNGPEIALFIKMHIPSPTQLGKMLVFAWFHEIVPCIRELDTLIFKHPGRVISYDWSVKATRKLRNYNTQRSDYKIPDINSKTSSSFANALADSMLESKFNINDARMTLRRLKLGWFQCHTQLDLCCFSDFTPNQSEAHYYAIPILSEILIRILHHSKNPCKRIFLKSDGLKANINIPVLLIIYVMKLISNGVFVGLLWAYNLKRFAKEIYLAVDLFHRSQRLIKGALRSKNAETKIILKDRTNVSYPVELQPTIIDCYNRIDVLTFIKARRDIYRNPHRLDLFYIFIMASFALQKTKKPKNRVYYLQILDSFDNDLRQAILHEIKYAFCSIATSMITYYVALLTKMVTFEKMTSYRIHQTQCFVNRDGQLAIAWVETPYIAAPSHAVESVARLAHIPYMERAMQIKNGYHSFRHWYGHLRGFFRFVIDGFISN